MTLRLLLGGMFLACFMAAQSPSDLWNDLAAKRAKITVFHQEFEVSTSYKTNGHTQASKHALFLDQAQNQWRERTVAGYGNHLTIFDGASLFSMEEGGDEYTSPKIKSKDPAPTLSLYQIKDPNWSKAVEKERRPCGLSGSDHQCVVIDIPLKPSVRTSTSGSIIKMVEGIRRVIVDTQTGLLTSSNTLASMDNGQGGYISETLYLLRRQTYGPTTVDASLFKLPAGDLREVKELSSWNAAKIKKRLAGNTAPELSAKDLTGKPVTLSAFKGKTVLLDFWATWCGPCLADAPALDKLYSRYGEKELMILSMSVGEDRDVVEKFLVKHPHNYPIILTTENDMPRPYQVGVFPTYIVVDKDGTVTSAVEGTKGFDELRKLLKKAGLETE